MSLSLHLETNNPLNQIETPSAQETLESQYFQHVCIPLDLEFSGFPEDFLEPNETEPEKCKPHLERMEPGLIVSTGTERSFFDLLLSDEDKCTGLVIRDVNPRVKAYTDFLILLFRISDSREEFVDLVANGYWDDRIENKIKASNLSNELKKYYLENLSAMHFQYMKGNHVYRDPEYRRTIFGGSVDYFHNDELFKKLQRYARGGKILSTVGDIGDLEFLKDRTISLVDTSNIHAYIILNLRGGKIPFEPRVVWTSIKGELRNGWSWNYHSYVHKPLSLEQKEKVDALFAKIVWRDYPQLSSEYPEHAILAMEKELRNQGLISSQSDVYNDIAPSAYSKRLLEMLEIKASQKSETPPSEDKGKDSFDEVVEVDISFDDYSDDENYADRFERQFYESNF